MPALLALGIVLSSATQMRFGGLPLGPGEFVISLWIVICIFDLLVRPTLIDRAALSRLAMFWVLFALALSIGACIGVFVDHHLSSELAMELVLHDVFAYLLMAVLSCLAVSLPDAAVKYRRTIWYLMLFGNIGAAIQLAAGWQLISLPSVNPWYWDRFRGWAENPNQLAITSCAMVLLAVHLASTSTGFVRVAGLLAAVGPFVIGRLSKSDTFISVMILSGAIFLILRLRGWLQNDTSHLRYGLAVLTIILIAVSSLPFAKTGIDDAEAMALSLTKEGGAAGSEATFDLRLYLWQHALRKGLMAGSFGMGPGPHLDPPPMIMRNKGDLPFEAHNTPLDIFLQGGILGVAVLYGLIVNTALQLYQRRSDALLTLLVALTIFSSAHFLIRWPIIWFALSFCVFAANAAPESSNARKLTCVA